MDKQKRIVIVGGVAGGMSAAARVRRLDERALIVVLERTGYVSFANCGLPYFLGGDIPDYDDLILQTPESLRARFEIDVRVNHEVRSIEREEQTVSGIDLVSGESFELPYDELILSVGAQPIRPPIPGLERTGVFTLRNMEDTAAIDSWIETKKPETVVVVGGGYIGLEVAEQFHQRDMKVHVIDAAPQALPPFDPEMAELVHQELAAHGVQLHLSAPLAEIVDGRGQVGLVKAGQQAIEADLVILGLGVRPDTTLAKSAGLALGARGGIKVDQHLRTEDPHIWAVGDAIEVLNPISGEHTLIALGGPANRQGRMVANNIYGGDESYGGTIGTAILRVFELQVGATGLKETQLQQASLQYEAIYLHPKHHAGYYPGAETIALKLLFNPTSGQIYGAQAVGKAGVDKRIDVIATAILGGMKVSQLAELELSYSPPFGSAKDPINLAGMMACNIMDGLLEQVHWHEIESLDRATHVLLDVRSQAEVKSGAIPGSLHIPLPELRHRLAELPKDKTVVAYCRTGQRSYFASRILAQRGFEVRNLSGAYLTYVARP
jgi:NADPH-dependent 2,4-dienoyl-CoA reductase/sulfur reductase-like enzyme/rhodanese-related sulfurtransferase